MEAGQEDLLTVDIFDFTGRMVKRVADAMPTVTGENNLHIGVSDLSEGTYLLAVSNRIGEKAVIKFIKN